LGLRPVASGEAAARKPDERNQQQGRESRVKQPSAAELLEAGIQALAHADVLHLQRIVEAAGTAGCSVTLDQQRITQERLQVLGALTKMTARNLRLLRGAAGYGLPGDRVR
jgi:hypothetical protein